MRVRSEVRMRQVTEAATAAAPSSVLEPELIETLLGLLPRLVAVIRSGSREMPSAARQVVEERGLSPRHGGVLAHLALTGSQSVSELSQRLGVTLATASLLVGELSRAGLVERREDTADRRRTLVSLAPAHLPAFRAIAEERAALLERALAQMEPGDRRGLINGLRVLIAELEGAVRGSKSGHQSVRRSPRT
jgi:DNA-binding MarR family transcriptional regulator